MTTQNQFTRDKLVVTVSATRKEMGQLAANHVAAKINELMKVKPHINMIFAAAPSQNEFLEALQTKDIDWERINAFHMDEYIGLNPAAPQGFGNFLRDRLFEKAPFNTVKYLNGDAKDQLAECMRYAEFLKRNPTDICCLGIGENTHLAFNDPHVADFNDPQLVKIVKLDHECRQQQVNDGCFATLNEVPVSALTLTIPALIKSTFMYCIVPGEKKAQAILHTLTADIAEKYPSTILRRHPNACLFIDQDSAQLL